MKSVNKIKIGDFCKTGSGGTPSRSNTAFFQNGTIPWVKSGELKNRFVTEVEEYITEEAVKKSSAKIVSKNSLLLAMYGATVGEVSQLLFDATTNQAICNILPDPEICDVNYLYRYLQFSKPLLLNRRVGGGQPNISQGVIKDLEVPLPPLSEQKRISKILDKADELRQKRQQSIEKLDELLQATFIDMFGDPVTNPKGWDLVKLSTIAEYFNGLTYKPENVVNNGTIVLRSSNIQNSGLDFNDIVRVNAKIKDKIFVKDNDILMCSRNGSAKLVGKVALIKNLNEPMTFGAFMMIIRSNEKYANYLLNYFKTLAFRRQISTGATTTINQITGAMLDRISLPLPNDMALNQFTEIAKSIETQKQRLEKQLTEQENLFKSLQQRAFNCEL